MSAKHLFRSTTVVSVLAALNAILGFCRDLLLASLFGASATFDAFLVAYRIPDFVRGLFADGAFAQAMVPAMTRYKTTHHSQQTQLFLGEILFRLAAFLCVLLVLGELLAPLMIVLVAPGFTADPYKMLISVNLLRLILPYVVFISLVAFFGALLNSYQKFASAAFVPLLLNIVIIIFAIYVTPHFKIGEQALTLGIFLAGLVQLLFLLFFVWGYQVFPKPIFKISPVATKTFKDILPGLFAASMVAIGLLINTLFASFLPAGAISWLYYADRLAFLPLGVIGVGLAIVILPHLSAMYARGLHGGINSTIDWAFRLLLIISLPAALGLAFLASPLTIVLFKHGLFSQHDVLMTQQCILAFAIGLPAFVAIKVLSSIYLSLQQTKMLIKTGITTLLINILFCAGLMYWFRQTGLALATSIASIANVIFLYVFLLKKGYYQPEPGWYRFSGQMMCAASVMSLFLWWGVPHTSVWLSLNIYHQVVRLLLIIAAAMTLYFGVLWSCGLRIKHFSREIIFSP